MKDSSAAPPPPPHPPPLLIVLFSGGTGFYGRWARRLTRSPIAHASVAHNGLVLNNSVDGDALYPLDRYLAYFPRLRCVFYIPVLHPLPPFVPDERDRPAARVFLRWLSGGRLRPGRDCISVTCDWIRRAGHPVPPRTCTAVALHHWLVEREYPHEPFTVSATCPAPPLPAEGPDAQRPPEGGVAPSPAGARPDVPRGHLPPRGRADG